MPLRTRLAGREARAELRRLYGARRRDGGAGLNAATLRVAHLLPTLEIGGKERSVVDLCAAAPAHGLDPLIVTYDPVPPDRTPLAPTAPHVAFDRRQRGALAAGLRDTMSRHAIDVLHAHGHVAATYAARGPRRVATIHAGLAGGWRWLPAIVPALRRMDRLVAVSDDLARATRRLALRPAATIATGVDVRRFAEVLPRSDRRAGDRITIGIAARLHPVKRHRDLFAAMRLLAARGIRVRLRVAGEGPLADELRAASATIPGVEMLGVVADMPAFYGTLDGFVLCSDHEGLPLAMMEAMASGLPCIAARVGGMVELIGDGTRGVIGVPRRDPGAIADAIQHLAAYPALGREFGNRARAAGSERSLKAQAEAYAALYRELRP